MLRPACLLLALAVAGCAMPGTAPTPSSAAPTMEATPAPTLPVCPSPELRQAAYDESHGFMDRLEGVRIIGSMQGTLEGDVGEIYFAVDPEAKLLHLKHTAKDAEVRVNGSLYSIETEGGRGQARDHRPGATFDKFYADFIESTADADDGLRFEDDLVLGDYAASCKTVGDVEVVEFRYENGSEKMVMQVERAAPHRPVAGEFADPVRQDNYRMAFAYGAVKVAVKTTLPKLPIDVIVDVIDYKVNERTGITMTASISEETPWVPLEELEFRLMDTDGRMWYRHDLADGFYDMEDNDTFEFDDVDANGLFSEGDVFTMDVGARLDIVFFDKWADKVAAVQGQA